MKPKFCLTHSIATLIVGTLVLAENVHALPKGETVRSGSASFERAGGRLNIRAGDRAIIDYRSFNISKSERVQFFQPGRNSTVLNRVTDANPTRIFGTLESNGRIVLLNPYGIFFENGSVINIGGLVAAAGNMSDSDFLSGNATISLGGNVVNRGSITAVDGVGLYGTSVTNSGTITSQTGAIEMMAGSQVYVGEQGGNIFAGTADPSIPKPRVLGKGRAAVSNSGSVSAPKVKLVAGDVYGLAIAQSGNIRGEDVTLQSTNGNVLVSGKIDASNRGAGKSGGKVKILGEKVVLKNAAIDASGDVGGGEIIVGGDFQGGNGVKTAKVTVVDKQSVLSADAVTNGNGGKVVVWADGFTNFSGTINARGGTVGGNGGLMEVSGKNLLSFTGSVDASAANGASGSLLLDPLNITIDESGANGTLVGVPSDGSATTYAFTEDPAATSNIRPSFLTGLNATVTLQAKNNITFAAGVNGTVALTQLNAGFIAQAGGNISFGLGSGVSTNNGVITLTANDSSPNSVPTGTGGIIGGGALNSGTAATTLSAAGGINVATQGAVISFANTASGNVTVASSRASGVTVSGTNSAPAGTVSVTEAVGALTVGGAITSTNGAISLGSAGTVNVNAAVSSGANTILVRGDSGGTGAGGTVTIGAAGSLAATNSTIILQGSDIAINAAATVNAGAGGNARFFTSSPGSQTMGIGTAVAVGGVSIDNTELGRVTAGTLVFGDSTAQVGDITFKAAVPTAGQNVTAAQLVGGLGKIVLDDTANTVVALSTGAGNVSFAAGTGGVTSATATNTTAEISTAGSVTLNTTGGIGTSTNRLQLAAAAPSSVVVGSTSQPASAGVFLQGLGSLTLGTINTNNQAFNVVLPNAGTLTASGAIATNGGSVTLNSQDALAVNGGITAGAGSVALLANQNGLATQGFTQADATTISGTGISITVNTAGTAVGVGGGAVVSNITDLGALSITTNNGTNNSTGNITRTATSVLSGTGVTLTTGTGGIGVLGTEINFGAGQSGVVGVTHGGNVFLTDSLGSLNVASVTTTGNQNAPGGTVTITTVGAGNALTVGTITTTGGTTTGAGPAGGAVTLNSGGTLTVGNVPADIINTSGRAGAGGGNAGGAAGGINLTAGGLTPVVTLNANLNAAGGAGTGAAVDGANGAVTFTGNVVTGANRTISGGTVSIAALGRLSPGGDGVATTLTINGSLTFAPTSTLFVTLLGTGAGTTFDQVVVNSGPNAAATTIDLNGATLASSAIASFNVGNNLRIIDSSGAVNLGATQFSAGLSTNIEGQGFDITYNTTNDRVTLTRAQTSFVWDGGGGDDNWTTVNNWVGNSGRPGGGDVVHFAGATRLTPNYNLAGSPILDAIIFDLGAGAFTLGGGAAALTGGITNNSATTQTVNMPVTLTADQAFNATAGPLAFGPLSSVGGAFTLTLNGGFNIGAAAARLPSTVTTLVDSMTVGAAFVAQSGALNLSGGTGGASLDLTNTATTTLVGALNTGAGNVTLAGAVTGGLNTITAATLTLNGAGAVGTSLARLSTNVNSLVIGKTAGNAFVSEANAVSVSGIATGGIVDVVNVTNDLTVGVAGLSNTGDVLLRSDAGQVLPLGPVTSTAGDVTLRANGALDTGAFLVSAPTVLTGDLSLISDNGTVTIGAGGVSVGNTLTIQIGAGLTLAVAGAITAPNVTLIADQMAISAAILATGTITLAPVSGINVTIGNATAPLAGLVIDNTELGFLSSASALTVGRNGAGVTTAGSILIGTATVGNGTLSLAANAGITQSDAGFTIVAGPQALTISAGGTVKLDGAGNTFAVVGGSTTAGSFSLLRDGALAGGVTVNAITTGGGDIAVRNFDGNLSIGGTLNSSGGNIAVGSNDSAGSVLALNAAVNAGAGSVFAFSSGGTSQNASGIITAAGLASENFASGNINLGQGNLITGNVGIINGAAVGNITFTNTGGFNVGGISSLTVAGLPFPLSNPGIRTTAAGVASLTAGGSITQSAGATNIISTGTLTVAQAPTTNPNVTLGNAANTVANLGAVSIGNGAFTLANTGNLAITGPATAGSGYTVNTAGSLTQILGSVINTSGSNGAIALTTTGLGGDIGLNANLNSGIGPVTLSAGQSVSQFSGNILSNAVTANAGALGSVSLNSIGNAFASITGSAGAGYSVTNSQSLAVAAGGIVNTSGAASLTTLGVTSDLTITGPVTANNAGTVTLNAGRDLLLNNLVSAVGGTVNLLANRNVTETAPGGVRAANLQAVGTTGVVNLAPGAANNNVTVLAGSANGDFRYTDANSAALSVGTVTTVGVTSATGIVSVLANAGTLAVNSAVLADANVTLTSNGNQTIAAAVTSTTGDVTGTSTNGTLDVNGPVTASSPGGDVTLTSAGQLSLNAGVNANTTNGQVTLNSTGASIIATGPGGIVTSSALLANALVNVDLARINSVGATGFAATATNGFVAFFNSGAITLNQAVTAGNAVVLANLAGDITQTPGGIITAGAGLLMQGAQNIVLDQSNLVTGNFAVFATINGDITFRNTGLINIGTVGPVATVGGIGTFSGIGGSPLPVPLRFLSLESLTGAITQDAGPGDKIVTGELRVQTAGGNVTLANPSNEFVAVGTVAIGAGSLTLVDSAGGIIVNGPQLNANGGVNIQTTGGPLTLLGDINVGAGNIVLRSTDQGLSLGSTLNASGLVQLDAGGVGAIVQTAGSILATSLIARAPGNVTLTQATNSVTNLAGSSTNGTFSYRDATAISVGTVIDSTAVPVVGLTTTNQDITVVGGAGDVAIVSALNAGIATVRLQSATGDITQTAAITGGNLLANATAGSVSLAGATNNVAVGLAGNAGGGSFRFLNLGALTVGSVLGDAIATASNGVTSNNTDIAIQSGGTLSLAQPIDAGTGIVRLRATTGDVTQVLAGSIVGGGLLVDAAGVVALTAAGATNDVGNLAGSAGTGAFSYTDSNNVSVAAISADGGGLGPVLPIGAFSGIATPGAATLTAGGVLRFTVPVTLIGSLDAFGTTIELNAGGNPTIQTSAGQVYHNQVTLGNDAILVNTNASPIRFLGTVNSGAPGTPRALTMNGFGDEIFDGLVGNVAPLASLVTDAANLGGNTIFTAVGTLAAPTVTTTGIQTYNDAMVLAAATVLRSNGVGAAGNIQFNSTVNSDFIASPRALTVNTSGDTGFNNYVGGLAQLLSLATDAGGTTTINVAPSSLPNQISVTTQDFQNYGDDVVSAQNTVLNGTFFRFGGTVTTSGGMRDFAVRANPGDLTTLSTVSVNSLTFSAVDITFTGAVSGIGFFDLAPRVVGGGSGLTGGSNAVVPVIVPSPSIILGANVTTVGSQTYNDNVKLTADVTMASTAVGNIQLNGSVNSFDATARSLTVNTGGATGFGNGLGDDRVGAVNALSSLTTDDDAGVANGLGAGQERTVFNVDPAFATTVLTTNGQTYSDAVSLALNTVLASSANGDVVFNGSVDSSGVLARSLVVNTGGVTRFGDGTGDDRVGAANLLLSLTTDDNAGVADGLGAGQERTVFDVDQAVPGFANTVITSEVQTYGDAVALGKNSVMRSNGLGALGDIRFNSSLDSAGPTPQSLAINTAGVTGFGDGLGDDRVGSVNPLLHIVTDLGGSTVLDIGGAPSPSVTTATFQSYNDSLTLTQNTVLASTLLGDISFTNTVDSANVSARSLEIITGGVTRFGNSDGLAPANILANSNSGRIGGNFPLLSVLTDLTGSTVFNIAATPLASLTTIGFQTYNDPVALSQDTLLTSDSDPVTVGTQGTVPGNNIEFVSTVDGAGSLDLNTAGDTIFNQKVGSLTPLASLTTRGGGKTVVKTTSIKAVGNQDYRDTVSLSVPTGGATVVFRSTGGSGSRKISFYEDVSSAKPRANMLISTGGDALLAKNVSVPNLTANVAGITELGTAGNSSIITTNGAQKFSGKVSVVGDVASNSTVFTAGGALSIQPGAKFTVTSSGKVTLTGGIGSNGGDLIVDAKDAFLAGGAVNSDGRITIKAGGKAVEFQGSVTGGGVLNINQGVATPGLVTFAESVKQGEVTVNGSIITIDDAETSSGNLTLSASSLLSLTGTKYKSKKDMLLNDTPRLVETSDATILKEGGNLSLTAGGKFVMGRGQKLLVDDGALSISARTARLGDLAALTNLSVQAGTVELLGREPGSFKNDDREDLGLGFVGQTINFGNANLVFVPGGPAVATFGTAFGLPVGVTRTISNKGITFVTIDDFVKQFHQDGTTPNPMGFGSLSLLQPIANGVRSAESTETQTMVIDERPEPFYFEQNASLSAAIKEALKRMSISPRDATAEESISMSLLRGLLRQPLEGRSILEDFEYLVVVNRLTKEEVDEVLDAYLTLTSSYYTKWKAAQKTKHPSSAEFLRLATSGQLKEVPTVAAVYDKSPQLSKILNDLVDFYKNGDPEKPNRELGGFLEWLQAQRGDAKLGADAALLADNLDLLADLINRLGKIGLTKKELEVSKKFVVSGIANKYPELVADLSGVPPVAKVTKEAGAPPEAALPPPPADPPLPQTDLPIPKVPDAPVENPPVPAPDAPVPPGSTEPPVPPGSTEPPAPPAPPAPENPTPAPAEK